MYEIKIYWEGLRSHTLFNQHKLWDLASVSCFSLGELFHWLLVISCYLLERLSAAQLSPWPWCFVCWQQLRSLGRIKFLQDTGKMGSSLCESLESKLKKNNPICPVLQAFQVTSYSDNIRAEHPLWPRTLRYSQDLVCIIVKMVDSIPFYLFYGTSKICSSQIIHSLRIAQFHSHVIII